MKLAYVGGGSLFVPSIVNGIGTVMQQAPTPFGVELSLYDVRPERAGRMQAYAEVVRKGYKRSDRSDRIPLQASVADSRAEALSGADLVLVSVWLQEEHERLDRLWKDLGFRLPAEGPGVAAWALACAPWSLAVAAEMRQYCPGALFVTLMNPTDVIAGVVNQALANADSDVRAAGLCVEVDGLRGALAYYFRVPYECIELLHAGVNHDGWILGLKVESQPGEYTDGYKLWRARWQDLERDPDYHPGNRGLEPILDLTGHLRSSGYHHWPYQVPETPQERMLWDAWQDKRALYTQALDEALQRGKPISDPPGMHPERSRLNYPFTGITVGKLVQSMATGQANVTPLQVPNQGAISNFPDRAIVEVPAQVQGRTVRALPVGELPEWLGGYTRLLAIQRRLLVEYVFDRQLSTLKRALATLPMFGTVHQLNRLAEALHQEFADKGDKDVPYTRSDQVNT